MSLISSNNLILEIKISMSISDLIGLKIPCIFVKKSMKTFPFPECVFLLKRLGLRCFHAVALLYCSPSRLSVNGNDRPENAGGLPDPACRQTAFSIVPHCGLDRAQNTIGFYSVLSKF